MKILSWNINSIRLRIDLLHKIIEKYAPDVICLQETKVSNELFPAIEIYNKLGYKFIIFNGEKSYNGVATLSKLPITNPQKINFCNGGTRHISCVINNIEINNIYVPAGGDIADIETNPKFRLKMDFMDALHDHFTNLIKSNTENNKPNNIIILGDLNIAPLEHDVWSSKQLRNVVSHTAIEREKMLKLQNDCDFIDIARHFIPHDQKSYSWWSYRNRDWKKSNRGRRLDHIWAHKSMTMQCESYSTIVETRDWPVTSDHIPIIANIKL